MERIKQLLIAFQQDYPRYSQASLSADLSLHFLAVIQIMPFHHFALIIGPGAH